jgi:uncharacterized RDD family membrane protein YckC
MESFKINNKILASPGHRLLNYIIDIVMIYIIIIILVFVTVFLEELAGGAAIYEWTQNMSDLQGYVVFYVTMFTYYIVFETYSSRTIAKYITKTLVVTEDGLPADLKTIVQRTFCRFIPFDPLSFLGNPSRGWHDSISNTYVVKKEVFERSRDSFYSLQEIGNTQD